jgi:hypothetical protein
MFARALTFENIMRQRRVEVVVRGRAAQVRLVARSLRRAGLAVRVPRALAERYGVVETRVEQAPIGLASQVALERIFDSLANETSVPRLHTLVNDGALLKAGLHAALYQHQKVSFFFCSLVGLFCLYSRSLLTLNAYLRRAYPGCSAASCEEKWV